MEVGKKMDNFGARWLSGNDSATIIFSIFTSLLIISALLAGMTGELIWMAAPFGLLLLWVSLLDFRKIYYLLLFSIPFSIEMTLPGGFGTDFPSEPLMLLLTGLSLLFFLIIAPKLKGNFFRHPITVLLFIHLVWIFFTSLTSSQPVVSFKFFAAKLWYVVTFYFLGSYLLKDERSLRHFFWLWVIAITTTVVVVLVRHAGIGFSFKEVHTVMGPFFRNHVMYASIIVVFLPFLWYARGWILNKWYGVAFWLGIMVILLLGVQYSYTRAAYISIFIAIGAWQVIRWRLVLPAIFVSFAVAVLIVANLAYKNTFLDFAPKYERTVSHTRFSNLVEATYKLEDISTMERVYRWVAGAVMLSEKPVLGFGPGNFFFFYKSYSVLRFKTYVSDNPDNSGIHNYYLMTATEQGIPGLLVFLALCFYTLIRGERVYHATSEGWRKRTLMASMLSMVIIFALLLINDMVETDKVGAFFFLNMGLIVRMEMLNEADKKKGDVKHFAKIE